MDIRRLLQRIKVSAWSWLGAHGSGPRLPDPLSTEAPLRDDLYSADQMEQHGKALAARHVPDGYGKRDRLLQRLDENEQLLAATCALLTRAVQSKLRIAPAGEWLLDNFYLIEEQIRIAREHLPRRYSRQLQRLSSGPSAGLPRVYDIALESISHGDGRVDAQTLDRFVAAYQTVAPLKLGELWAIPIMLRLALLENLRRVGARIMAGRQQVNLAHDWADQMTRVAASDPKSLILVIADMARSRPPMLSAFVAELARRLQGHGPALALPLTWIEQALAESGLTIEQMVQQENQQQAADQVSMSNSIGSLRSLAAIDWRVFVEAMSLVEHTLREDAGGLYRAMDFSTRDRYRHAVANLARRSARTEVDVARAAISLAKAAAEREGTECTTHVGFYLIDQGRPQLQRVLGIRTTGFAGLRLLPLMAYLGSIATLTALGCLALVLHASARGVTGWTLLPLGLLCFLAVSPLACALVSWLATLLLTPKLLPRMNFAHGLPAEQRTLVVIPSMLTHADGIDELLEALEVRFLGNQDTQLYFALLTDYCDASTQRQDDDAALLQRAADGIAALNARYRNGADHFLLLHRPRRWNAVERLWMGYERKRGKLADLNALLRGNGTDRFALIVGEVAALAQVRYVITLDTDTRLPRDAARQFVGAMAHPLNRPRFDHTRRRVSGGYGILQPRMAASLAGAGRSRYASLCGSEPGIDPYTRSVSDVYQDLYGEGSFIGKGIYDVDAFEFALKARFPDNQILSHDLLEGCYARSGLLSDVHLYEEYPARYAADVARHQRWIRGDWQIAHWLLPFVPGPNGQRLRNPLSALSRWKMLDNLRRSLVPAALVLLLFLGWTVLPQPLIWSLAVAAVFVLPGLLVALVALFRGPSDLPWRMHVRNVAVSSWQQATLVGFRIACLPYEAHYSLSSVGRALWRMLVSGRRRLEWCVSGPTPVEHHPLLASWRRMWIAPVSALLAGALMHSHPDAWWPSAPYLGLWLMAPVLAWWLSKPLAPPVSQLNVDQQQFLRGVARRTYGFFEHYVGGEDRWLPPDNYQEQPEPKLAHRTSPTNMGLALLANLSAWDFGFIDSGSLIARSAATLDTMQRLDRYQGHFYNWYDTQTLQPLPPRYVSTVDSGNLAGHLLTLSAGLSALGEQPLFAPRQWVGFLDTLHLVGELPGTTPGNAPLLRLHDLLAAAILTPPTTLAGVWQAICALQSAAAALQRYQPPETSGDAAHFTAVLCRQIDAASADLRHLAPWLDLPSAGRDLNLPGHDSMPCLTALPALLVAWQAQMDASPTAAALGADWQPDARSMVALASSRIQARLAHLQALTLQIQGFAAMDYEFLYDRARHLLAIGYNVDDYRRDPSYYDLLASEARLCSFVAVSQGQLPQETWFALGRLLTSAGGDALLLSWSGSMFEYLMPLLVMPAYAGSLLEQTGRAAVTRQIAYGKQRSVPWGVSESGYNAVDASMNYRYQAFGVPGLGLKRGLSEDLVIAPYASALALMVLPEQACANLQRLAANGLLARYGYFEAIDYTPSRLPRGQSGAIVRSYMAHHQGMVLLSLGHVLQDRPMQRRFESAPLFQATLLLLQERVPKTAVLRRRLIGHADGASFSDAPDAALCAPIGADTATPEVQLLSNGRYHLMLTNTGGGYSRWRDLALTRWREDSTCDPWGSFLYLRDVSSGQFWSAAHQPTCRRAHSYEAVFSEGRAEFRRRDHDYECYTEIVVSPEDDIELRRLRITNRSALRRTIEITSYSEVVLVAQAADVAQSAFGNLFVQTEILGERRAILCTRRPRSPDEQTPSMFHLLAAHGTDISAVSFETDRLRFVGRLCTLAAPQALLTPGDLSGTAGPVLMPIVAIRCCITLAAEQSATIDWVSGIGDSRDACLTLIDRYRDRHLADRVFDLASTHGGVTLRQINASEADAQAYRRLAGSVLYANAALRADATLLRQNRRGQSGLWGYAISGDLPIVLLKIADTSQIELARQMILAHAYWRLKGLAVDLVIWNEDHVGYRQVLQEQIMALIATGSEALVIDRPGGIFVRSGEQMSQEDRVLMQAVARAILVDGRGSLQEQTEQRSPVDKRVALLPISRRHRPEPAAARSIPPPQLQLGNPYGGFSPDGTEYWICTTQQQRTPLPWCNVLANAGFGCVVTESGPGYSWSENAHEFRLTPWSDDAVGANAGEAYYLRDEESGYVWSPTPLPASGAMPYLTRHGYGYSVYEHTEGGIHSELWIYVDVNEPVKYAVLTVRNGSGRTRSLSATGYVEWVLGDVRGKTAMHVVTEIDPLSGALMARNAYNAEFGERVAFFDIDDPARSLTGDRNEFLGRNGRLAAPDALTRTRLSGKVGAALDPCAALQVRFDLLDGQSRELVFTLGSCRDQASVSALALRLHRPGSARTALAAVRSYWQHTLGAVQIQTPDPALNVLTNGWLIYQTLACRVWARSGYYQSGGAYGFRDQLQDLMALVHTQPALLREHLLRCAARQYEQGDVQHWWHPPSGRGVRTRCSDDYLWLPLALCRYVRSSADRDVLNESVPYLAGRPLNPDEESYYDLPSPSTSAGTLYEHALKAIQHGLRLGVHGLPLIGSGDWNDGMNLVGIHGRGESVWLGFFLHRVLLDFADLAQGQADQPNADWCRQQAAQLQTQLDQHGWDGEWYRRAWFDDGTPLGSAVNSECKIDSIAQSWSVLSGAGTPERTRIAMNALDQHLVRRDQGLVQLLDPPFDSSSLNPGYIKGYLPGVRENGGQYTHAAIWAAMAFAALGDAARAWQLMGLLNPIHHGQSARSIDIYRAEPYVVAADIYAKPPHSGRGGWTWYTGSAGWMYRLVIESLLGLRLEGARLTLAPCLPRNWPGYTLSYRFGSTRYLVSVVQCQGAGTVDTLTASLDGSVQASAEFDLGDDQLAHRIDLLLTLAPAPV